MSEKADTTDVVWDLRLFATLQEDAVRDSDSAAYHAFCTRRLARLRHARAVRTMLVHNPRYVGSDERNRLLEKKNAGGEEGVEKSKTRQRRHAYAAREGLLIPAALKNTDDTTANDDNDDTNESSVVPHPNMLWTLLYQAQRCGAQARTLTSGTHVRRRLQKAVQHAEKLEELACRYSTIQVAPIFQAECRAYLAFCRGQLALSRKHHAAEAAQHYQACLGLLQGLEGLLVDDSPQAMRNRDIWTQFAEGTVRPLLRYCEYETTTTSSGMAIPTTPDAAAPSPSQQQQSDKDANAQPTLSVPFMGREISLQGLPKLSVLYIKIQQQQEQQQDSEEAFVRSLDDLDTAHGMVQEANQEYAALPDGPAVSAKRQDLKALDAYFSVLKLECQREHQERLLISNNKDADNAPGRMVHAYTSLGRLVQSALDTALEFVVDSESADDDEWLLRLQAHVVRLRAHRAAWLARWAVWEAAALDPTQALAWIQGARQHQIRALEEVQASELDEHVPALEQLEKDLDKLECQANMMRALQQQQDKKDADRGVLPHLAISKNNDTSNCLPLWQRPWDGPVTTTQLGNMTLEPTPIPPKPVTCDIAGSLLLGTPIDWSAIDQAIAPAKKKSGLLGWFQ